MEQASWPDASRPGSGSNDKPEVPGAFPGKREAGHRPTRTRAFLLHRPGGSPRTRDVSTTSPVMEKRPTRGEAAVHTVLELLESGTGRCERSRGRGNSLANPVSRCRSSQFPGKLRSEQDSPGNRQGRKDGTSDTKSLTRNQRLLQLPSGIFQIPKDGQKIPKLPEEQMGDPGTTAHSHLRGPGTEGLEPVVCALTSYPSTPRGKQRLPDMKRTCFSCLSSEKKPRRSTKSWEEKNKGKKKTPNQAEETDDAQTCRKSLHPAEEERVRGGRGLGDPQEESIIAAWTRGGRSAGYARAQHPISNRRTRVCHWK